MTEFLAAIACFLLAHMIPPVPPVRRFFIGLLGQRTYMVAYSLLSLALIAWVIVAALRAPYVPLWPAERWQALVPLIAMPFALWFMLGGLVEPNPLSISLYSGARNEAGPMARVTRHPVLWGFLIWALSHIAPNGNLVALILFGGMAALAAGGFGLVDRRARRRLGEARWQAESRASPLLPFAAATALTAVDIGRLLLWAAAAVGIYLWFLLQGHSWLIGTDPLARFGS